MCLVGLSTPPQAAAATTVMIIAEATDSTACWLSTWSPAISSEAIESAALATGNFFLKLYFNTLRFSAYAVSATPCCSGCSEQASAAAAGTKFVA